MLSLIFHWLFHLYRLRISIHRLCVFSKFQCGIHLIPYVNPKYDVSSAIAAVSTYNISVPPYICIVTVDFPTTLSISICTGRCPEKNRFILAHCLPCLQCDLPHHHLYYKIIPHQSRIIFATFLHHLVNPE